MILKLHIMKSFPETQQLARSSHSTCNYYL